MADEDEPIPRTLRTNRKVRGKVWLAGSGPRNARIMLVTAVPLKEEAAEEVAVGYGKTMPHKPRMGDCAEANALKKIALRNGLDFNQCFYVPIVRYFPDDPKHHTRPTMAMLRECLPLLEADIREIKPEIIVCVGKIPFDVLYKVKYKESEIYGAWFWSDTYKCKIYPTLSPYQALKAELHERYAMDFRAVQKMFESMHGHQVQPMEVNAHVISNSDQLRDLTKMLRDNGCTMLSVDCEWHGNQHVDGKLRSLQIAWSETDAAYIRFMDDKLNYAFDVPYKEAGAILGEWLDQPQVKYCGHHLAVDLSWMNYWLGLEWWEKGVFDTEFALQCCDESLDLGLDALALRYTDFGKYDMELINWKKQHLNLCKEGYGYIPDEILIPYGVRDVLTVMRAMPVIKQWLIDQDLLYYYETFFNPLVTDVNISFTLRGIPIDRAGLDHKRRLYQWAKTEIEKEFQKKMTEEAGTLLLSSLQKIPDITFQESYKAYKAFATDVAAGNTEKATKALREAAGAQLWPEMEPVVEHYLCAPNFNIRSKPQMARWLYQVKGYTPVKSTQNKSAGMPSVAWEKVLTYPPDKQRQFIPATDTQTLETLAAKHKDKTISLLLELNGIGNITKAFLKESDVDDEGNLVKENGLHYWLASDDAIHVNHSTTETGGTPWHLCHGVHNVYEHYTLYRPRTEKSVRCTALIAGTVQR